MNQDRRPGLDKLIVMLMKNNPAWSMDRARAEAKVLWHAKHDSSRIRRLSNQPPKER